jgi:hypothetical protein
VLSLVASTDEVTIHRIPNIRAMQADFLIIRQVGLLPLFILLYIIINYGNKPTCLIINKSISLALILGVLCIVTSSVDATRLDSLGLNHDHSNIHKIVRDENLLQESSTTDNSAEVFRLRALHKKIKDKERKL